MVQMIFSGGGFYWCGGVLSHGKVSGEGLSVQPNLNFDLCLSGGGVTLLMFFYKLANLTSLLYDYSIVFVPGK
jgi:hypothetical protein